MMRLIFTFLALILFGYNPVFSQVIVEERIETVSPEGTMDDVVAPVEEERPSIFTIVEKMPDFKGGSEALKKFIQDHLIYPKDAIEQEIQGTVYIKFVVRANGKLTNFEVLRSLLPSLSKAALDVVQLTAGDWTPGEQNGKKVDVYYTVPVRFSLKN
jgi:periplasmic protein TonB